FARKKGGKAFTSPIELYLDEHNVYEPDALYLVPDSNCTVNDKRLVGAPELVVEVLSPSTAKYDRHQKFNAYEQHAVREYWIVDPANETVEVYTLADNTLNRQGVYNREDEFTSPVLAQTVSVADVFADV
ncbi:MAG: Uma2 family endonuclease, partial [Chloroflexota bacterium]